MKEETLPSITEYLNYRDFLSDYYTARKKANPSYSYRVFTTRSEIGSPSHLMMVIDGERNLTLATIPKYQKAIGFKTKDEEKFFEFLVLYNQEQDPDRKIALFQDIMNLRRKKGLSQLQKHQFNFLAKWYYVAIYVLVDLPLFRNDPDWISEKLRRKVSAEMVRETLDALEMIDLIEKDPFKGYRQKNGALTTGDEIRDMSIHKYHKSMLDLAMSSLNFDPLNDREFNGGTISIRKDKIHVLKDKIRAFRKEINELTSNMDDVDQVYQMNIQLFPLTEVIL